MFFSYLNVFKIIMAHVIFFFILTLVHYIILSFYALQRFFANVIFFISGFGAGNINIS